jgi:hypothetical protein
MRPFILGKFQGFRDEREELAITGGARGAWDDGQPWARGRDFTPLCVTCCSLQELTGTAASKLRMDV